MKKYISLIALMIATAYAGDVSQVVTSGNLVFVSAQLPIDATGHISNGTMESLTALAIGNLKHNLSIKGVKLNQVIHTTVYLTDIRDFEAMDYAYSHYFTVANPPTRDVLAVSDLPNGARIQISCIADKTR